MIVLLVLLMVAAITLFIIKAKNPSAYWMASVLLGWFFSMVGLVLFISKYGGFYYRVNIILFLTDSIRDILLRSPISIDTISRMITYGRSLFIFSLTGLSICLLYNKPFKQIWNLYALNAILPIINALFYDPIVYRWSIGVFDRQQTYIISIITRSWVVISTALAVILMVRRYKRAAITWVKKQLQLIITGVMGLMLFYFYLVFMGPMQVTDVRTYYFLYSDFSNFNPPLTVFEWYAGIAITTVTAVISIVSIWKYTDVEKQIGKADLRLERKLKIANMGVQVFTHGIKNQLIMTQVLLNQTNNMLQSDSHPNENAINNINKITDIINQTLGRLDQLYSSFKTTHIELKPVSVNTIIKKIEGRINVIPENIDFKVLSLEKDVYMLADQYHITDAVYNILVNAFEAIGDKAGGVVSLETSSGYNKILIKITDNGPGIPKEQIDTIFDPFFTSKNTTKNWGVGLSYAKQVINSHFGHIQVHSTVGEGSSFSIFLPVYTINTKNN